MGYTSWSSLNYTPSKTFDISKVVFLRRWKNTSSEESPNPKSTGTLHRQRAVGQQEISNWKKTPITGFLYLASMTIGTTPNDRINR
jgi:hypothetical protein